MDVIGTVVEIKTDTQVPKTGGGTYPGALLTFRNAEGKIQEKGFHQNALKFNPALKNGLDNLSVGDTFTMVMEKEGEYWNAKSIAKGGTVKTNESTIAHKAPTTYPSSEERALTQKYIIRQNSITNAVAFHSNDKTKTLEDIKKTAEFFESWIVRDSIFDIESDII